MRACERPGCALPVRHSPHVGGEVVEGWAHLCCEHVDVYMRMCAASVPLVEGVSGWSSWLRVHEIECGPLEVAQP